jgi:gliding motility-associated-like protein
MKLITGKCMKISLILAIVEPLYHKIVVSSMNLILLKMARVYLLITFLVMISLKALGQCPTLTLKSTSVNTCGLTIITIAGNTFGGSATQVSITENGAGSVTPAVATTSPFSFTYTPASGDLGKTITITVTTNNPSGAPCSAAKATCTIRVNANPASPSVGTITAPTCQVATGSVVLSNLPSSGTWTLTRSPGGTINTGTGTKATISGIPAGTYTYVVTNSVGCSSAPSANVIIPAQPFVPAVPVQTVDCSLGFGKATVTVTSPTGTGLTYSIDAGTYQSGTSFLNVVNGTHSITVRSSSGCTTTGTAFQVNCGCVNQPTVTLSSSSGNTCSNTPVTVSGNTFGGSATSVTITENGAGTVNPTSSSTRPFAFTYTPVAGDAGKTVTITVTTNNPLGLPCAAAIATYSLTVGTIPTAPSVGVITQPTCSVTTGSVILNGLPATGNWILTRSPGGVITTGTGVNATVSGIEPGTYTFTVTLAGCTSVASANIVINPLPSAPPPPVPGIITQPTCSVTTGSVVLNGLPLTASWTITRSPGGIISTGTGGTTTISGLPYGTFTFTVTNSLGCVSGASASVVINQPNSVPGAPVIETIIQPSCSVSTGSIILNSLPSSGMWTLTRAPDGVITTGSGTSIAILNLSSGTYSYTVTNSAGCSSPPSNNILIITQPVIPGAPAVGTIIAPTCTLPSGSVSLSGLPSTGTWTVTQYPGTITSSGTGSTTLISGLSTGVYNYTVSNSSGCVSLMSANVTIPFQPASPSPPLIGTITQPHNDVLTGSVELSGLPANGNWTLTLYPGNITAFGSGSAKTISGLNPGTYSFTVTNAQGCTSVSSARFEINSLTGILLVINNPAPVCAPSTVDLTAREITSGSSSGLTFTYWTDIAGTIPYINYRTASAGTYYIKGTAADVFSSIKPVTVRVYSIPVANAGTDQLLAYQFETTLHAQLANNYEKGIWSLISGTGEFSDTTNAETQVSGLLMGKNLFRWTVTNEVCPAASDTVIVLVHGLASQTLITPNMDGKNDYFILKGSDFEGKMDLIIFDRRGVQVYKNSNYDNSWNGVDNNGKILPDDTYFYIVKTGNGINETGYIVVRR